MNDTATTAIYTLSLHDALPISVQHGHLVGQAHHHAHVVLDQDDRHGAWDVGDQDRKSTRLNSSHVEISYAVFCLKKKKKPDESEKKKRGDGGQQHRRPGHKCTV